MTVAIILPRPIWDHELDRVLDDFFEAMEHEARTGFVTRVALEKIDKNDLPVYKKIPDDELTYIEWRCNVTTDSTALHTDDPGSV